MKMIQLHSKFLIRFYIITSLNLEAIVGLKLTRSWHALVETTLSTLWNIPLSSNWKSTTKMKNKNMLKTELKNNKSFQTIKIKVEKYFSHWPFYFLWAEVTDRSIIHTQHVNQNWQSILVDMLLYTVSAGPIRSELSSHKLPFVLKHETAETWMYFIESASKSIL